MSRVRQLPHEETALEMRAAYDAQIARHGRMTNMKRTLGHSPAAFHALMEWYPLYDEVRAFLGDRAAIIFTHAISAETDCLICSTFFRRMLAEWGEEPDSLKLEAREQALVDYGRAMARGSARVAKAVFDPIAAFLDERQLVALTAFGAIMIATNLFNNALEIDLDEYLHPYQRKAGS